MLYNNLNDYRNSEIRFAILNLDLTHTDLVKMDAEALAPSSLKNRRIDRQNKYFKEQVLMKEDTKIIAKTHKGESILTVDKPMDDEFIFNENKDNLSEKASFEYQSDNEEKKDLAEPVTVKPYRKEIKYKNLTPSMKELYYTLEEYTFENVRKKLGEKLKILKPSTIEEIQNKLLNN